MLLILVSPPVFGGVRVAHLFSFLWYVFLRKSSNFSFEGGPNFLYFIAVGKF
jgi:hypothetical protein